LSSTFELLAAETFDVSLAGGKESGIKEQWKALGEESQKVCKSGGPEILIARLASKYNPPR
jgi:hypothetical protein